MKIKIKSIKEDCPTKREADQVKERYPIADDQQ